MSVRLGTDEGLFSVRTLAKARRARPAAPTTLRAARPENLQILARCEPAKQGGRTELSEEFQLAPARQKALSRRDHGLFRSKHRFLGSFRLDPGVAIPVLVFLGRDVLDRARRVVPENDRRVVFPCLLDHLDRGLAEGGVGGLGLFVRWIRR